MGVADLLSEWIFSLAVNLEFLAQAYPLKFHVLTYFGDSLPGSERVIPETCPEQTESMIGSCTPPCQTLQTKNIVL